MIPEAILLLAATWLLAKIEDAGMAQPSHYAGIIIGWACLLATAIFKTT